MKPAPRLVSALALLAGLLQAASLATPWSGQPLWWLQILAQGLLVLCLLSSPAPRAAARTGWLFGLAWLGATFGWLYTSMHTYGDLAAPLAGAAVLGLAGFLSLYLAAACALFARLRTGHWSLQALLFAACWLLAELARAEWFTGFPWGATGYAHVDGPLAPWARWVGVYGIGFVAAAVAFALAQVVFLLAQVGFALAQGVWQGRQSRHAAWPPLLLALALLALGPWLLQPLDHQSGDPALSAGRLSLSLLQGNIPQDEKFQAGTGVPMALQWYGQALRAADTALVVAPETAFPLLPDDMPAGYWAALQTLYAARGQAALVGTPLGNFDTGYTNAVLALGPAPAPAYRYDKHHLVPFGEFIPPLFRWFTELMHIPLGDFNRGELAQASLAWQGQLLAPNICFEDLFGEELAARFVDPAAAPTILVNLSNLAWFGNGQAIDQHLQISRMRSLELQRPMVRATNTGATVVINQHGQVQAQLPRGERGVLVTTVEGRHGSTPYAWMAGRFGLWPWWLAALAVLLGAAIARRARARIAELHPNA